jgi:hypothetical protein
MGHLLIALAQHISSGVADCFLRLAPDGPNVDKGVSLDVMRSGHVFTQRFSSLCKFLRG